MNTPVSPPRISPTRGRAFRTLHRYLGLALLLPVLLLATTGVLLEFTDSLKLGTRGVTLTSVHTRYGVTAPDQALHSGNVFQVGERLFTEARQLKAASTLKGAHRLELIDLIFLSDTLIILPRELNAPPEHNPLPDFQAVGYDDQGVWVLDTGTDFLFSNDLGASWGPDKLTHVNWLKVERVPVSDELAQRYGAAHVSWERWLQDLHSGRFFGPVGVWIMSLAGLALLALAATGLIIWLTSLRK